MRLVKKFPHITRIINAGLKYAVFAVLLTLIFLNYHTQLFPENEEYVQIKLKTLENPFSYTSFTNLGIYLENHGLYNEAIHNFKIAQTLFNSSHRVLGEQASPFTTYEAILNQREQNQKIADFWKKTTEKNPEYRDAYIQLGIYLYRLGLLEEAKKAILKAYEIDPLYPNEEVLKILNL